MILNRYYGPMIQDFPVASVVRMARKAIEQEVRDELKPIWLVHMLVAKMSGQEPMGYESMLSTVMQPDSATPSEDVVMELESIARRYREVQDGVDIPAVR